MSRTASLMVAISLALSACGAGGAQGDEPTSTSTTPPDASTASTVALSTTTTSLQETVESLEGRGRRWNPDQRYTAPSFLIPVEFQVDSEGWGSTAADVRWVDITYDGDNDGEADATLTWLAYMPDRSAAEIIEEIGAIDGVSTSSPIEEIEIEELSAMRVTVEAGDSPSRNADVDCSRPRSRLNSDGPGFFLLANFPDPHSYGIPSCTTSQIWVLSTSDHRITIIGVASDADRFEELMRTLEDFLLNSVTFGDSDG